MTYRTQATPATVMRLLEEQLFTRRNVGRFHADSWTDEELVLISRTGNGRLIVTIRNGQLTLSGGGMSSMLEGEVLGTLRRGGVQMEPVEATPTSLKRRFVVHPHMRPDCRPRSSFRRGRDREPQTHYLLADALQAAESELDGWVVFSDEAWRSAKKYRFVDLGRVKDALRALALAARLNAQPNGLGMRWDKFMAMKGLSYSPNSSESALQRYKDQYTVRVGDRSFLTQGHIRFGTGRPPHCARIYVRQPDKPGDPVIVGTVGPHLDIPTR